MNCTTGPRSESPPPAKMGAGARRTLDGAKRRAGWFSLALRIARRNVRHRALWRAAFPVGAVAGSLVVLYVVLQSAAPTLEQEIDRDFGRFENTLHVPYGLAPGDPLAVQLADQLAAASDAQDIQLAITTNYLPVAELSFNPTFMKEMDWSDDPFPGRFTLTSGEWPTRAGEVVLADWPTDNEVGQGDTLQLFDGLQTLRVVGTVDDSHSGIPAVLAAPGTWASLPPEVAQGHQALRGTPIVYWNGDSASIPQTLVQFDELEKSAAEAETTLEALTVTKQAAAERHTRSGVSRAPAAYTVPSLLLPALAVVLFLGTAARRLTPQLQIMWGIGVPRRVSATAIAVLAASVGLLTAAIGSVLGAVLAFAARPLAAAYFDLPGAPDAALWEPVTRTLLTTLSVAVVVGAVYGTLYPRADRAESQSEGSAVSPSASGQRWQRRFRDARHVTGVALACVTAWQLVDLDSLANVMVATACLASAVALFSPEVLQLILRILPERGPRTRLARRHMLGQRPRLATALGALTIMLSAAVGLVSLADTTMRSGEEGAHPDVLPGQLLLAGPFVNDLQAPSEVAREAAQSALGSSLQEPVQLKYLIEVEESEAAETFGTVSKQIALTGDIGILIAVDSSGDAERVLGADLSAGETKFLEGGGALVWSDARSRGRTGLSRIDAKGEERALPVKIDTMRITIPPANWRSGRTALMLSATATGMSLPVTSGGLMYTGLDEGEVQNVRDALSSSLVDPGTTQVYEKPVAIPNEVVIAAATALALVTLVLVVTMTNAQARALRGQIAHLCAIGLPPSFGKQIVALEQTLVIVAGTLLGLLCAVVPLVLASNQISGFALSIPLVQVATLTVSILVAALAGALLSVRQVTARERAYELV